MPYMDDSSWPKPNNASAKRKRAKAEDAWLKPYRALLRSRGRNPGKVRQPRLTGAQEYFLTCMLRKVAASTAPRSVAQVWRVAQFYHHLREGFWPDPQRCTPEELETATYLFGTADMPSRVLVHDQLIAPTLSRIKLPAMATFYKYVSWLCWGRGKWPHDGEVVEPRGRKVDRGIRIDGIMYLAPEWENKLPTYLQQGGATPSGESVADIPPSPTPTRSTVHPRLDPTRWAVLVGFDGVLHGRDTLCIEAAWLRVSAEGEDTPLVYYLGDPGSTCYCQLCLN